jgi:hypothetical protein
MPFAHRSSPATRVVSVALIAFAFLSAAAHAADKKAASPAPAKTPLLTMAQLRECVAQKDKLGKDTDAAVKAKAEVAALKADIDSSGAALAEQANALDRTSEEAVSAYNAKIIERNARVDEYQVKANAYNAQAEAVLALKESYEKSCADRRYDDRDLADILRKK